MSKLREYLLARLLRRAKRVVKTASAWGPTDDGTKEGKAFEDALTELGGIVRFAESKLKVRRKKGASK